MTRKPGPGSLARLPTYLVGVLANLSGLGDESTVVRTEAFALQPARPGLLIQQPRLRSGSTPIGQRANVYHVGELVCANPDLIADLDGLGGLGPLAIHLDVTAVDLRRGLRTCLEEPRRPEPLIHSHVQ